MKSLLVIVSLATAFIALPAVAQQGPAGVPGITGLFAPAPPPPPAAQAQPPKAVSEKCAKSKNIEQCKAREEARKKTNEACKGKTGTQFKQCVQQKRAQVDCSKATDPGRCEQHRKAHELCQDKIGTEHRQCLRDNLAPKK